MYPANFYAMFPPFPLEEKVFVAMSFAPAFTARWDNVLVPAIRGVTVGGVALEPVRVDQRTISDSILTEILSGIGKCRLIFADITCLGKLDGRPMRNDNVLYEVGIAHATRQPAEVILFRSDDETLMFDVGHVRVNKYDPDGDPEVAVEAVQRVLLNALNEVSLMRNLAVQKAAESLDPISCKLLLDSGGVGSLRSPITKTVGQMVASIHVVPSIKRLLELGLLRTDYAGMKSEDLTAKSDKQLNDLFQYKITPFGAEVIRVVLNRILPLDVLKAIKVPG